MKSQIPLTARNCCTMEKQAVVSAIRACDFCSESYSDHRSCYRRVAKKSGERSRECMIE